MRLTPDVLQGITKDETGKHYFAQKDDTYKIIVDNLRHRKPFAFSRWGDSEINAVLAKKGKNCDGHEYFVRMGLELKAILYNEQPYMMAIGPLAAKMHHEVLPDIDWHNAAALADASIQDGMKDFFEVLERRRVDIVIVGHESLVKVNLTFAHVPVPEKDAWLQYDRIMSDIKSQIGPHSVVLLCCGMMSGILLHELYKDGITVIDAGSVFDPYVNRITRGYHKSLIPNL